VEPLEQLETWYEDRGLRPQRRTAGQMVSRPKPAHTSSAFGLGADSDIERRAEAGHHRLPAARRAGVRRLGVNSDGPIVSLIARGFVDDVGQAPVWPAGALHDDEVLGTSA
jgi:hypothetical protein